MSRISRFFVVVFLLALASHSPALPPPDNPSKERASVDSSIIATMGNVDDVGLLLLWNGNDEVQKIGYCEWQQKGLEGQHGATSVDVSRRLNKGTNYLIFVLYNQIFTGPFGGGKWSGDFKLKKDNKVVWETKQFTRNNEAEIKYWKMIRIDVDSSGSAVISDSIPERDLKTARGLLGQLESALIAKAPRKTASIGNVIGTVLTDN